MTRMRSRTLWPLLVLALAAIACASPPARLPSATDAGYRMTARPSATIEAAGAAISMIGAPYRYGGSSPAGFDCSGLVIYSYAKTGVSGLPHSAAGLEHRTRPVSLQDLEPGDLLFFQLSASKTSHVAIYVGDRAFVHAPSGGKRVERVSFDHVYWGRRLGRAGRLDI